MLLLPPGMKRHHSRAWQATASSRGSHLPIPRRGLDHMGMAAPLYYTAEMVRTLPEDRNRYETVHGELLVTPAPRVWHQVVLDRVRDALNAYVTRHPQWYMLAAPADISPAPDVLVQPDLFVVPIEEVRTLDWARLQHLELVVEVVSPTTARADRFTKRRLYQDVRVPAYWIVDADEHYVEIWTPDASLPRVARDPGERRVGRPDLHVMLVRVHDPIGGDPHILVQPALRESVGASRRGAHHFDHELQVLQPGPVERAHLFDGYHEQVRLHQHIRCRGDVGRRRQHVPLRMPRHVGVQGVAHAVQHNLVPHTGGGRHQQLPVHRLVAVAVLGERAHHLGRVIQRRRHAHMIESSTWDWQVRATTRSCGLPRARVVSFHPRGEQKHARSHPQGSSPRTPPVSTNVRSFWTLSRPIHTTVAPHMMAS